MSGSRFPKTKEKVCDVFVTGGYVNSGCYLEGGKLIPAFVPAEALESCPYPADFVGFAESAQKFIVCAAGNVYTADGGGCANTNLNLSAQNAFLLECPAPTPVTYVIGGDKGLKITDTAISEFSHAYGIVKGVIKNGRIFAVDDTDGYTIRWSGPDSPDDWAESSYGAGCVHLNRDKGKICALVVFKDEIAVLCERGLAALTVHGTPENFKLVYLGAVLPQVYGRTAAVVCNKLVFFAGDGLYAFDGTDAEEINFDLKGAISDVKSACALGGWYYINGYCKSLKKEAVLCVNIGSGRAYFADITGSIVCGDGKVYCFKKNKAYVFEKGEYVFSSGNINFDTPERKVLTRIEINSAHGVDLEVTNGFKTRILRGVCGNLRINMSGKSFKITVRGSKRIDRIKAFGEVIDDL